MPLSEIVSGAARRKTSGQNSAETLRDAADNVAEFPINPARNNALEWAAAGYRVVPIPPNSKRCITPNWPGIATRDAATITGWFEAEPNANYGVVMGDDLLAVDPDMKTVDGIAAWEAVCAEHGAPSTSTLMAETPTGGRLFYRGVAGLKNTSSRIAPGVDSRSGNGYGRRRQRSTASGIAGLPAVPRNSLLACSICPTPPEWLVAACQRSAEPRTRADDAPADWNHDVDLAEARRWITRDLEKHGAPVDGAGSDDRAYVMAGRLDDLPITDDTIVDLMAEHWAPPLRRRVDRGEGCSRVRPVQGIARMLVAVMSRPIGKLSSIVWASVVRPTRRRPRTAIAVGVPSRQADTRCALSRVPMSSPR